jgi:general secretion pathway protein M
MKNWFLQKTDSEQKIIVILAVFTLLLLLYAYLFVPLKRNNTQLRSSISDIENEITIMRNLETQIARFGQSSVKKVALDDSQLMAVIEQSAKTQGIDLTNIKSQSNNKILVNLNNVLFNTAVRWLDVLQNQYQISVLQLTVDGQKKGLVNMTVTVTH